MAVSRKGMSPLIATVLLMAFAVALGGMIMNWSGDVSGEATLDCSAMQLDVNSFCYDGAGIRIDVRNTGEETIGALTLKIDNPRLTLNLEDSELRKGMPLSQMIPFGVDEQSGVSLFASIIQDGEPAACPDPVREAKPLPKC